MESPADLLRAFNDQHGVTVAYKAFDNRLERVLMIRDPETGAVDEAEEPVEARIDVVLNWRQELLERAPIR